jgi:hypothetical protein
MNMRRAARETDAGPVDLRHLIERQIRAEFASLVGDEEIARIVAESLAPFDDVRVRTFVSILALRNARHRARTQAQHTDGSSSLGS